MLGSGGTTAGGAFGRQRQPHEVRGTPGCDCLGRQPGRSDGPPGFGNRQRQRRAGLEFRTWQAIGGGPGSVGLRSRRFGQLLDKLLGNELDIVAELRIGRQRTDCILGRSLYRVGQPVHQTILLFGRAAGLFPQRPDAVPGLLPIDQVAGPLAEGIIDFGTVLSHHAGDGCLLALVELPQQSEQIVPSDGFLAEDLRHPVSLALGVLRLQREKNCPGVALLDQPQPGPLMVRRQLGSPLQGRLGPRRRVLFLGRGSHQETSRQQQTQRRRHSCYTREVRHESAQRAPRKGYIAAAECQPDPACEQTVGWDQIRGTRLRVPRICSQPTTGQRRLANAQNYSATLPFLPVAGAAVILRIGKPQTRAILPPRSGRPALCRAEL